MKQPDPSVFHALLGVKRTRISYQRKDFLDYLLMSVISGVIVYLCYGPDNVVTYLGLGLCVYMIGGFVIRHGFELTMPLILRRPQDVLYMVVYKIRNMKPMYFVAILVLLMENYLIALTPDLPHNTALMKELAINLFYLHLVGITLYRTATLVAHLRRKAFVREVLMDTPWKTRITNRTSIVLEILHAFFTGLLTHVILIAPWYLVINFVDFSLLFAPLVCVINLIVQMRFLKDLNAWFYRDHWLGHNSELEFVYLHGPHHDAMPSGLIGVAGNGYLEGFLRHTLAFPVPFFNPFVAFLLYTLEIKKDIDTHQYIPGIFPVQSREFQVVTQHSIHHFGRLAPYSFGINLEQPDVPESIRKKFRIFPDELKQSAKLDEQLTSFKWSNSKHEWYLRLFDKYSQRSNRGDESASKAVPRSRSAT